MSLHHDYDMFRNEHVGKNCVDSPIARRRRKLVAVQCQWCVTLAETETSAETDSHTTGIGFKLMIMFGRGYSGPRPRLMQISIGSITHFIGLVIGLGVGVGQCK